MAGRIPASRSRRRRLERRAARSASTASGAPSSALNSGTSGGAQSLAAAAATARLLSRRLLVEDRERPVRARIERDHTVERYGGGEFLRRAEVGERGGEAHVLVAVGGVGDAHT